MLFNSFSFFVIFPFIFAVYWVFPNNWHPCRKWWLIFVSYLLYMNWNPAYSLILIGVTAVTYLCARAFEKANNKKTIVILGGAISLLPLVFFKYFNFINEQVYALLSLVGLRYELHGLNLAIPVGISFYTFQALGYMLDVYYGKIQAERNFTDYVLFCSFFPQTASGPISKYSELMLQLKTSHPFDYQQAVAGLKFLLWGVFLKCVVADRLGLYVDVVYGNYEYFSGLNCFIASVFYTIQIYGDFAGYSLMAVGIGKTLGFDLINNFERPYLADSVTNFWRRWHISLTRWLTAYVYIPLGGSRCSKIRHYWNIMVTFLVSGFWHGANWTFVVWGMMHGLFQIVEKMLGLDPKGKYGNTPIWIKPFRIAATFLLVNFAWIFFRMPTFSEAWGVISQIFSNEMVQPFMEKATNSDKFFSLLAISILFAVDFRNEYLKDSISWLNHKVVRYAIYVTILCLVLSCGVLDASSFIYVSF